MSKFQLHRLFGILLATLCIVAIPLQSQAATKAKPKAAQAQKERLVLMPIRLGAEDQQLQGTMESALVDGLQQKYTVMWGEEVEKKAKEIFRKENLKHECNEERCMQGIAEAFQSELLATVIITKQEGGYFLTLTIQNLYDHIVVFTRPLQCKGCDSFQVVDKLKELGMAAVFGGTVQSGGAQPSATANIALPTLPTAPSVKGIAEDADGQTWAEVVKGNTAEDYKMYLESFPKGQYAKQAIEQKTKLGVYAKAKAEADAAQAELNTWNKATQIDTEESYNNYLKQYPTGPHAVLARIKGKKAKEAEEVVAAKAREEAAKLIETNMVAIPGKNYELGKYEVTQKEWRDVMGSNPSKFTACGDNCPVEEVSWDDVQEFLQKLNAKTGKQYRLPTEAEWEYACYGGSQTEYCGSNDIDSVAWHRGVFGSGNADGKTHPVGQKQANGYGLYDMSGNVGEWMQDWYDSSQKGRVIRGNSWYDIPHNVRVAYRGNLKPTIRSHYFGFRLARTLP